MELEMAEEGVPHEEFSHPQRRKGCIQSHRSRGQSLQAAEREIVHCTQAGAAKSDEVTVSELCSLIADGTLPVAGLLLWKEGMGGWAPVLECVDMIDGLGVAVAAWETREHGGAGETDQVLSENPLPTRSGRAPKPEPEPEPEPEPQQAEEPPQQLGREAEAAAVVLQSHTRGHQTRRMAAAQRLSRHLATLVGIETARDSSLARLEMDAGEWLTAHGAEDLNSMAAELGAGTLYDLMAIIQAPVDWTVFFDDDKTRRDALWKALQQEKAAVIAIGKRTIRKAEPESPTIKREKAQALSGYMQQVQAKRKAQDESRYVPAPPEDAAAQTIQATWRYRKVMKTRSTAAARIQAIWRGKQARLAQDAREEELLAALINEKHMHVYDDQDEDTDEDHVTIVCPAGAESGDLITVSFDAGEAIEVVVPEGIYPGMPFIASRYVPAPPEDAAAQTIQATWRYRKVMKTRSTAAARIQAIWRGKQARLAQDAREEELLAALINEKHVHVYDDQDEDHVTIVCPAGAESGDLITVSFDAGEAIEVVVPEGIYPGMPFIAGVSYEWHKAHGTPDAPGEEILVDPHDEGDYARTYDHYEGKAEVTVVCPVGADSGDLVTLSLNGGELEVVIPDGICPGMSFIVNVSEGGTSSMQHEHAAPPVDVGSALLHAEELQSTGKWNDAYRVYTEILENSAHLLTPGDLAELYNRRGLCCEKVEHNEQALGDYCEGIQFGGMRHSLLFHRGRLLVQLGRWSEANRDLSSARDLQPSHDATVELLQQVQERIGEMSSQVNGLDAVPELELEPEPESELGPLNRWWESEEMVHYHTPGATEPSDEVPLSQLCSLIVDGTVPAAGSSLWQEGMTGWAPILECVDAFDELAAAVTAYSTRERVFYDDVPGLFSSPDHVDLAQCEGMLSSRLITVPESVTKTSKYWTAIRENRRLAVERLRQNQSPLTNATRRPRVMDMGEFVSILDELRKHSALVFDCGEDSTTVYRLQYEPASGSVRANIVAECAGVGDMISRHAGAWFLKFARLTYEAEKTVNVPEVVMVGTAAWHSADSDDLAKKWLHTIWNKFKKDHRDGLDRIELRRALDEMGKVMADDQFSQIWMEMDKDDSGQVCFKEFIAWYRHHHDDHRAAAGAQYADRARDLVSSLTHSGMLCKRVGGSEQALFESLAVCEAACRVGMNPRPNYFVGTGESWIHCVALNATESPIIFRNDERLGWSEGVRRLNTSLDPLAELDAWLQDTVVVELGAMVSSSKEPVPVLHGSIVLSGAAFEAAEAAGIHSEVDQLKPICAKDAIDRMSAELTDLRKVLRDNLISYKTAPSLSPEYIEGQQVARQLCNLTLHVELLKRRASADTTLFFKAEWKVMDRASVSFTTPKTTRTLAGGRSTAGRKAEDAEDSNKPSDASRPTWVIGWYMHLLSSQFGVQFSGIDGLIEHLNVLYGNAIRLGNLYDKQHASSLTSAIQDERVALTLVTMRDVVEALRKKAQANDPIAISALQTLSEKAGGAMEGLEFRLKSEESLFRKLIQRLDRQLTANEHIPHYTPSMKLIAFEVDDCLRYTIVIPTSKYTEGVSMILSRLTSNNPADECAIASKVSAYNFWSTTKGATTYMGINAFVTLQRGGEDGDNEGYTFELQFHTPEGMAMKMGESHRLYEEVRSPKRTESERLEFYLQLKGLWDSLPVPFGVEEVGICSHFLDREMEGLLAAR